MRVSQTVGDFNDENQLYIRTFILDHFFRGNPATISGAGKNEGINWSSSHALSLFSKKTTVGKYSGQSFTDRNNHAPYTASNDPHTFSIRFVRSKFHSSSFFVTLPNSLQRRCFTDHYKLNLFMVWVNSQLYNPLTWVAFRLWIVWKVKERSIPLHEQIILPSTLCKYCDMVTHNDIR